jgi:hypothetical protein
MLVMQSLRGDDDGESKPRNKRRYDEGTRDKFRPDGLGGRPGQKLPSRARGGDDDVDDVELDDDDDLDDDDLELDEDDDFELDEDDDFEVGSSDDAWDKDDT